MVAGGHATFDPLALPEGPLVLTARVSDAAGNSTEISCSTTVDLTAPVVAFQSPACDGTLDAAEDRPGEPGVFDFVLETDAEDGAVLTLDSSATAVAQTGMVATGSATLSGVALPQGTQRLTATVLDAAGNPGVAVCDTLVDVVAPAGPALAASVHRSRGTLTWVMPGDDGLTGTVAGWELRHKSCDLSASCALATEADFLGADPITPLPATPPGGTAMRLDVAALALEQNHAFALRSVDAAGNASPLSTISASSALSTWVSDAGEAESYWGYAIAGGTLAQASDGSLVAGLVVGRPGAGTQGEGALEVFYSDGRLSAVYNGGDAYRAVGLTLVNVGDLDGNGFDEIALGEPTLDRVLVFFSSASGLDLSAPLQIDASADEITLGFGQSIAAVGRVAGPAGSPKIAIGCGDPWGFGLVGRVVLYDVSGTGASATATRTATLMGVSVGDGFGTSVCGVGDVDGDGTADLLVGAPASAVLPEVNGRAYLFLGGTQLSGTVTAPAGSGPFAKIAVLGQPGSAAPDGFGSTCARLGTLDAPGPRPFVVGGPKALWAFRGRADITTSPPGAADLALPLLASSSVAGLDGGRDFDGDGLADLAVGDFYRVWLFAGDASDLLRAAPVFVWSVDEDVGGYEHPVTYVGDWAGADGLPDLATTDRANVVVRVRY